MIRDDGKYFSPDQAAIPDIEADWDERDIGGLGMFFVKELMDHVTYQKTEQNVNLLVLEKDLGPSISQKESNYGYSKQTGR
jgi:anti-sigma regulatory factor (Ser/Thr protein kinase)